MPFASWFCAAKEVATQVANQSTEVLTDAVGKAKVSADQARVVVKGKANEVTLKQLKESLEGHSRQMWEAPDVFVTLSNVGLQEGVGAADLLNFHLKGVTCTATVEVAGTAAQLAAMTTAMGTTKVAEKVKDGEDTLATRLGLPNLGLGAYVAATADAARQGLRGKAADQTETKSSDFDVVVDLVKTLGVQEVKATATIVRSTNGLSKYMSNSTVQQYVEEAISREVSKEWTSWRDVNVTSDKAKGAIARKAGELAQTTKETAQVLAEAAKAKAGMS